jgi:hypothetical protein
MEIDDGYIRLNEVIETNGQRDLCDANEATTRKLVIDKILERVLGWIAGEDIKYEERVSEDGETTFADYVIATTTTSMVLEAKRHGKSFSLPSDKTSALLGGVLSEGDVGLAIRQVRDYARGLSVQFAVVTNGSVWIIFPAIRTDLIPFEKTRATVFRSLGDIKERFIEFWELLSRQRVLEGGLESFFFPPERDPVQRRLVTTLREPGYRLGRNRLYEYIEPVVTAALTDEALLNDAESLEKCYVKNTERVKFDSRIRMYLQDVKPTLDRSVARPRAGGDPQKLDKFVAMQNTPPQRFLLVLGPVGAGKTTFLQYTKKVSARDIISGKVIWLDVDFRKATEGDDPRVFIFDQLSRLIEEDQDFSLSSWEQSIRPAYRDFIEARQRGTLAPLYRDDTKQFEQRIAESIDQERAQIIPFVERIIRNAARRLPVYLVIDNVDQIEDENYQRRVFIETQAVARRINSHVIMSLRDATYLRHKASPTFDAFQVESIYIDPPPIRPVLSRRFAYAKKVLDGVSADILSESGIRFHVPDLSVFFEIVSRSILADPSGYLIEALSGSDIRRGLEFIREFLASGHTSADHALMSYLTDGSYHFPRHEIFKGVVFGQRKYYREETSQLLNIFDAKLGNSKTQLLRLRILLRLVTLASDPTFEGATTENIAGDLYRLGVPQESVVQVLKDICNARFLQTSDRLQLHEGSQVYPTRLGGFIVNELASTFMYFEPCLLDAHIYSEPDWLKLNEVTSTIESVPWRQRIDLRIQRAEHFLEYINMLEKKWIVDCKRYHLDESWGKEIGKALASKLRQDFDHVRKSAERTAMRKGTRPSSI